MLKRIFALGIAAVAFGSLAFVDASNSTALAGEPRQITDECTQQLSFDGFQAACSNPLANGWQIRPPVINVTCTKRELVWLPSRTHQDVRLSTLVDIDVSLGGKKKCVDDRASYQSEITERAICYQFEQVERTYSRTIQATCDDLAKFTSAIELCDATLKGSAASWTLVSQDKTNKFVDSCAGSTADSSISVEAPKPAPNNEVDVQATGEQDRTQ